MHINTQMNGLCFNTVCIFVAYVGLSEEKQLNYQTILFK